MSYSGLRPLVMAAAVAAFVTPLVSGSASAQTDREKAWHDCLIRVNAARPRSSSGENDQARTAAFKACMAAKGIRP